MTGEELYEIFWQKCEEKGVWCEEWSDLIQEERAAWDDFASELNIESRQ